MKRIIFSTLLISFIMLSSFTGEKISSTVIQSFQKTFSKVSDVKWKEDNGLYKAEFYMKGYLHAAWYDEYGKLNVLANKLPLSQLPSSLQDKLKDYSAYNLTDVFEVTNEQGSKYYVTLQKNKTKIVLVSSFNEDWKMYKKEKNAGDVTVDMSY